MKEMMERKKNAVILLAVILSAAFIFGCGGGKGNPAGPSTNIPRGNNPAVNLKGGDVVGRWALDDYRSLVVTYTRDGRVFGDGCEGTYYTQGNYIRENYTSGVIERCKGAYSEAYYEVNNETLIYDQTLFGGPRTLWIRVG